MPSLMNEHESNPRIRNLHVRSHFTGTPLKSVTESMAVKLAILLATLVCSVTAQCNTPWEDCGELLFGLGRLCITYK